MNKNKVTLYHYSNKELKQVKPCFFASNAFTFNDLKASKIKRSFFYIDNKTKESFFYNCKYCYNVIIDKKSLYDLKQDKDNLKIKFKGNINGLLIYCKKHYKGIIYNVGYDIVSLFYNVSVKRG